MKRGKRVGGETSRTEEKGQRIDIERKRSQCESNENSPFARALTVTYPAVQVQMSLMSPVPLCKHGHAYDAAPLSYHSYLHIFTIGLERPFSSLLDASSFLPYVLIPPLYLVSVLDEYTLVLSTSSDRPSEGCIHGSLTSCLLLPSSAFLQQLPRSHPTPSRFHSVP